MKSLIWIRDELLASSEKLKLLGLSVDDAYFTVCERLCTDFFLALQSEAQELLRNESNNDFEILNQRLSQWASQQDLSHIFRDRSKVKDAIRQLLNSR